jgi:hypothetical protein
VGGPIVPSAYWSASTVAGNPGAVQALSRIGFLEGETYYCVYIDATEGEIGKIGCVLAFNPK